MAEINVGDIVKLKSGSVPMTVSDLRDSGEKIDCVWFDKEQKPQSMIFTKEVLSVITAAKDFEQNP